MKAMDAVKIGGILFAGVAAYLVVTRTIKAGGDVVAGAKKVVKEDLNPASDKNIVYVNTPEPVKEAVGDFLGSIFDPAGYKRMKEAERSIGSAPQISNVKKQAPLLTGPDESVAETARLQRSGTPKTSIFNLGAWYGANEVM
ncbi:MAG: hypothetical protein EBR27_09260 [Betaproteobacteria bacterium]|nr:hypothetical protein [Betaproteobacteria bacterium]